MEKDGNLVSGPFSSRKDCLKLYCDQIQDQKARWPTVTNSPPEPEQVFVRVEDAQALIVKSTGSVQSETSRKG
jgi:hypothetical protein